MSLPLADAFKGRRIFMTGHTGFKGSWLALWLHKLGAQVFGYSLAPPTEPNNFELSGVRALLAAHHESDIRDAARLAQALNDAEPEVVFHLAAQALVREGYARPRETFDTNVLGTANLLEAVRMRRKPCVAIVVTSDKCYAPDGGGPAGHRETDPLGGEDPYSASKAAAEHVVAAYRRAFFPPEGLARHGVKVASVRAGNVIGGGDWAKDRIVTDIVRSLAAQRPVPVRNPRAVRPWQHVLEPLGGYLTLAARMLASDDPHWPDAWNFGPRGAGDVPVVEVVNQIIAAWGAGTWQDVSDARQPPETAVLRLSIEKAVRELGWSPRWDLREAVRRTAAWYRAYYENPGADMRPACLDDIAAYEAAG
jgi:CDP-glucose 4,6-dehydratase